MSKRTLILIFSAIALIFAAYLSFKNDKSKPEEMEPEEMEPEELEPEEVQPEPEPVKRAYTPKTKDIKINKTLTDEPIQEETGVITNE